MVDALSRQTPSIDRRDRRDPPAETPGVTRPAPASSALVAEAAVDNERAAEASARLVSPTPTRDADPALPAADAATTTTTMTTTTTAPASVSDALLRPTTAAGRAAVLEAVAARADVSLRSAPATEQHLQMAENDVMLVQHALHQATPEERAAGIPDPTRPGETIRVSAAEEAAIAGADALSENRGLPSLEAARRHVLDRFTRDAAGGPEAAARLEAAWASMPPEERAAVAQLGRDADIQHNAPGFTDGFVDGVRDSVTGIADTAAFAAELATDPAARARFQQDAQTITEALQTPEGRTAVREALGDQAETFLERGPAYVAGYLAGQVAAGAVTGGATALAGRAATQGMRLVAPEVVAAATRALEVSRNVAARAAVPAALGGAALLATSSEAQAAVGEVASLAAGASAASVAAVALGAPVAARLSVAMRDTLGRLVRGHIDAGDPAAAARLIDDTRDAIRRGTGDSLVEAAAHTQRLADASAAIGPTFAASFTRNATEAIRLNDPRAARRALADIEAARVRDPDVDAVRTRLQRLVADAERSGRVDAEGTFTPSIEAARNAALAAFGRVPHSRAMTEGRFDATGLLNGIEADGRRMRVDWDPEKGLHYNVEVNGRAQAFVVEGDPATTYGLYLTELQRYQR